MRRGARSLVSVMPASLVATLGAASASPDDRVSWASSDGVFTFAVCRPSDPPRVIAANPSPEAPAVEAIAPVIAAGPAVIAATSFAATGVDAPPASDAPPARLSGDERLIGTLVHRLFQREADVTASDDVLARHVVELMRPIDLVDAVAPDDTARRAVAAYRALRAREDVAAVLSAGVRYYEVPISFLAPDGSGTLLRGSIDCVVDGPGGELTVLEFKTGRPRAEHERQAELYARALEQAMGRGPVRIRVCYT